MGGSDLASGAIGLVALILSVVQTIRLNRQQRLAALQGTKEAVGAAASRVAQGEIPRWSKKHRLATFEGLCLAAVFERSGRSRALIYAGLNIAIRKTNYRNEILPIINGIRLTIARGAPYTDLTVARRRLVALESALNIGGDVRLRISRREASINQHPQTYPYPVLPGTVTTWAVLAPVVSSVGDLVVIQQRTHSRVGSELPVLLCLDFHLTAKSRPDQDEAFSLTLAGRYVRTAKYGGNGVAWEDRVACRKILAEKLSEIICAHPAYSEAKAVLAVPGSEHTFSVDLARQAARLSCKPFVEPSEVSARQEQLKDQTLILIDDVYRSGVSWNAQARALTALGVPRILGLAATCTLSDQSGPCRDDDADRLASGEPLS